MNLEMILDPLLRGDLTRWKGLPSVLTADFDALFGVAIEVEKGLLGHFPATRHVYTDSNTGAGLILWTREDLAVMVETLTLPPASILAELPAPSAVLPQEILVPDAYAHEYLYCATGLVLTVARALRHDAPDRIVRCRGIKPLSDLREFGQAYYQEFDDQVRWFAAEFMDPNAISAIEKADAAAIHEEGKSLE